MLLAGYRIPAPTPTSVLPKNTLSYQPPPKNAYTKNHHLCTTSPPAPKHQKLLWFFVTSCNLSPPLRVSTIQHLNIHAYLGLW
ncbi:hypothetical protein P167DRAFT_326124 [Morchella conica CCBAS932]|uniref:Uncharacterized protein n=1 Tax=Morchella conica CCBAS932 TaxID=1392247 RepID=A0A3N4KEN2_9PEZI|nr:hypothetical protein P167DRAFT_326124 [Morchella conica CCBAS932]